MNKTRIFLSFLVFLNAAIVVQSQQVVEAIVAVVNDEFISLSEYKQRHDNVYRLLREQLRGEEFTRQYEIFKNSLMDNMITEVLLLQEARRKGFNATDEVQAQIERMKEENGFTSDQQLIQALAKENVNFEDWKAGLEMQVLQQMVLGSEVGRYIVVDDSEIVGYYNQHQEDYREPDEYTLKGIYVSSEEKTEEDVQSKKEEIEKRLKAGEDMSSLATQYGEGPEKDSQGDLGSFVSGQMLPNMEQAVEGLQVGELTDWIEMPSGWYILRLEDKRESRIKAFEEARDEIEALLFNEKNSMEMQKYLEGLKNRNYIKILIPDPLEYKKSQ